jgi:hypothetical protein
MIENKHLANPIPEKRKPFAEFFRILFEQRKARKDTKKIHGNHFSGYGQDLPHGFGKDSGQIIGQDSAGTQRAKDFAGASVYKGCQCGSREGVHLLTEERSANSSQYVAAAGSGQGSAAAEVDCATLFAGCDNAAASLQDNGAASGLGESQGLIRPGKLFVDVVRLQQPGHFAGVWSQNQVGVRSIKQFRRHRQQVQCVCIQHGRFASSEQEFQYWKRFHMTGKAWAAGQY